MFDRMYKPFYIIIMFSVGLKHFEMNVSFSGQSILIYESIFVCKVRTFLDVLK